MILCWNACCHCHLIFLSFILIFGIMCVWCIKSCSHKLEWWLLDQLSPLQYVCGWLFNALLYGCFEVLLHCFYYPPGEILMSDQLTEKERCMISHSCLSHKWCRTSYTVKINNKGNILNIPACEHMHLVVFWNEYNSRAGMHCNFTWS